ncbi:MAG: hypothetical protein U0746_08120 [Gemmataceae bacterium]
MLRATIGAFMALLAVSPVFAGDVGFIEDFALAKDRTVALRQLIPGTEDYYYYHALHALNTEQFERIEQYARPWAERFGQTPRYIEIQTRNALLTYDRDPKKSLTYLRTRLNLVYNHERENPGAAPNLPTTLDQSVVARARLQAFSLGAYSLLENFEDSALDWLAGTELNWERRRNLLQRLRRPDVANLVKLVADDLTSPHATAFGSYPIHGQMTLAQLDELVTARPQLLNEPPFVQTYLVKLQPGADDDWKRDPAIAIAYFDRLQKFTDRLAPAHNALKAHVLYHRLAWERAQGVYDRTRFLAYLKLPRQQGYMARALLERPDAQRYPANLNADFGQQTLLRPVHADEPLVRDYLMHFLKDAASPNEFAPTIDGTYLQHLFAEVKIVNGLGDPEQWASKLPPEAFRALKERIDIDFAPTNKTDFATDEPVRLSLFVKNVPSLLVKVFEVNTGTVYRTTLKEIDTDINLDGLVANEEKTYPYADPPLRRVARTFDFPQMAKPGVYVVDFIGAGKSSRALVRKGRLRPLVTTGTAGLTVRVVDEANKPVNDAAVWLGGTEYKAEKDGTIAVPYSTNPGRRPIVLSRGDFACLDVIDHKGEDYRLTAGLYIDRESLLASRVATLVIRPGLLLNGTPVSTKLLEDVKLRVTSTDHDGIATSVEVPNFKLFEDRETTYDIRVPARLATLAVTLNAKVKSLSRNQEVRYEATETFALNGIDRTDKIEDLHFAKFAGDFVIEVLGRTGEAKPNRAVHLALKHRDFKQPVQVTLKTDERGRITLGPLADVASVTATGPEGTAHTWTPPTDRHTYRQLLHARAGDTVTVPYTGQAATATREELALFEVRGNTIRGDHFDALALRDGLIEMRRLAAGDYELWLKRSGEKVRIRVAAGVTRDGFVLGQTRQLQTPALKPVAIRSVESDGEAVTVRLTDASKFARVHVFATRYRPAYSAFGILSHVRDAELSGVYPARAESVYLTGRNIGDEYRYVLDRRAATKFPGNMLDRPQLLLNPWAVRSTETGEQQAEGGEHFGITGTPPATTPAPAPAAKSELAAAAPAGEITADLDYLADAAAVLVNLIPDANGVIRIPRKDVGPHAMVTVVAVDPLSTSSRTINLADPGSHFLDLRLASGLDPAKHYAQAKQVSILTAGKPFELKDVAGSRFEAYDSLAKVYALYATLTKDAKLAEFEFLVRWPALKPEEKRSLYSKHASHELNFFIAQKDPAFFKDVVRPHLTHKKDKTFLDHWLLGDDLTEFLQPWQYGRLNAVERVLLARRIDGEPAKTARHLSELFRLHQPNVERLAVLFDTAVKGGDLLADGDAAGFRGAQFKAGLERQRRLDEARPMGEPKGDAKPADTPAMMPPPGSAPTVTSGATGVGRIGGGGGRAPSPGGMGGFGTARQRAGRGDEDKKTTLGLDADVELKDLNADGAQRLERERASNELFFDAEGRRKLGAIRQLYRRIDPTQEWAENNYHHLPIHQQLYDLVAVNAFWLDYAKHDGRTPFLSKHVADACRNFTEMALALAVLDLPFDAGKHVAKFEDGGMTLTPATPVIAFHEEVRPADGPDLKLPVLVSQNFYRAGDRYREENGERLDKFVKDEFVVQTVYGCQLVVTNPSSSRQKLSVLVQLPIGAIPVANGQFTKSVALDLEPYRTQTVDYHFYFPRPGRFAQFPAHVAKGEKYVAVAPAMTFNVVATPSQLDTTSWEYVSQNGTNDDVVKFLDRESVAALNLDKIAFRMKDRGFFETVTKLLATRHAYSPTLWSYALLHGDVPTAKQYLTHADPIVAECGGPIVSTLLTVDPVERHSYEHLEYKPLVNARAHALGKRRQIVNDRFNEQYHHFLKMLSYRATPDDGDRLETTYYLTLQDRIEEAMTTFATVNAERVPRMPYDYCAAYLQMSGEEPLRARSLVAKYAAYPVDRWRNAFAAVGGQLDEIEGKAGKPADQDDRNERQQQLAATEPNVEFTLDARKINLTWQNVGAVRINYYLMDVELLFSRNPFVQQSGGQFAWIKPNLSREVPLPAGEKALAVPLPEEFANRNVLVEVTAAGKSRALPYYANAMDVKLTEGYGQVRVTDAGGAKPLAKVYVKTYVKLADGTVKFHKDGYTDHRGRFDYATVSTPERVPPQRFAVLVLSDERGATIREAAPPQQ